MSEKRDELLEHYRYLIIDLSPGELLSMSDPDLLKIDQIMEEIKKIDDNEK